MPTEPRAEPILFPLKLETLVDMFLDLDRGIDRLRQENEALKAAIAKHHSQKGDDRCMLDDDELYKAAGLPVADRRVGDKAAMLKNCERFIERRCESGGWKSYAELEAENGALRQMAKRQEALIAELRQRVEAAENCPPGQVYVGEDGDGE